MSTYAISKSSLLSLKAEILRKQEEVGKAKLQNKAKELTENKKGTPLDLKNKGVNQRQLNDVEDENLFQKSKLVLEAKAKLYDQLSKGIGNGSEEKARFLVRFDRKRKLNANTPLYISDDEDDVDKYPESDEERHYSDEYEPPTNPGDEWVEYVDCLGRTRKCLRKDLDHIKERDSDLKSRIHKEGNDEPEKIIDKDKDKEDEIEPSIEDIESNELLYDDMRKELLRKKWEKEEEELQNKPDIHYQDILFDEARMHGVGYYGFSKDKEERSRQQEALKKLREQTQQEQKKAETLKQMRDKQLADRTKAARNRKRARMGLPPEEDEPEETKPQVEVADTTEANKEEEMQQEKERELLRQKHIRPWDLGKEGVKVHVEYTQEDWVQKKRRDRVKEFAPPSSYNYESASKKSLYFTTKRKEKHDKRDDKLDTSKPPPKINNPGKKRLNPYSNDHKEHSQNNKFDPEPIINECVDFDDEQDRLLQDYKKINDESSDSNDSTRGRGVEIAPPPTFEYYGPSSSKKGKANVKSGSIEDSIYAGLQFLREQADKKNKSSKHPHDMFLL